MPHQSLQAGAKKQGREVGEQKGAKDQPWGRQGREPESIMTMTAIMPVIYGGPTSSRPCADIGWTWLRVCQVQKRRAVQAREGCERRQRKSPCWPPRGAGRGQAGWYTLASSAKLRSGGGTLSSSDVRSTAGSWLHPACSPSALPQPVGTAGHSSSWMRDLRPVLST